VTGPTSPEGVIHDIGYQRYRGTRLGRGHAVGSLYLHSLRTAYGLGRSAKAKIFPWLVVGIITSVAAVTVAIQAVLGEQVIGYAALVEQTGVLVILFCAVVAPELVSRDLRNGTLPLYFSRPLRRSDYGLAKLAALVSAAWLLLAGPQLLMFVGSAFITADLGEVWDEAGDLLPGMAYAAITVTVFGAIALLVASLMRRRAFAAGAVVAVFLVTTPVVGVLQAADTESIRQLALLFSPVTLVIGVQEWLFGTPGLDLGDRARLYPVVALALVGACIGLLVLRYRRAGT
jgi:ABC-2 type transport system permease protein